MKNSKYRRKQNQTLKNALVITMIFVIVGTLLGLYRYYQDGMAKLADTSGTNTSDVSIKESPKKEVIVAAPPASTNISVPYAAQAPFGNWAVHEESCEEAALLMYHEFLAKTAYVGNRIPDATADPIYRAMKSWQVSHYGKEPDLTMEALGKFANEYYGYKFMTTDATEANIKRALANGSPVIVPVMTHSLLNNMYGPYTVYHVLLLKGYDATSVITNDAGVGNGPDHHYDWNILFSAIDAQTPKMNQGRVMLTLAK